MFQNLLKKIARGLASCNIPYMVIGGQAILLYGEPRLTKDIDISIGLEVDELEKILSIVEELNLKVLIVDVKDFVKDTMVLPVIEEKSGIRVDFIFSFSPYERQAIKRTNNIKLGKIVVRFASLEDVLIHKIIAGRARDIEDAKCILLKNPDYNAQYIAKWLAEFDNSLDENFTELFDKLVKEIEKV